MIAAGLTPAILHQSYVVQDLFKTKQYDAAEAVNAEILATGFQDPRVFHTAGTLAYRQGRFKEAIAYYRRALALTPSFRPSADQLILMLDCDPDTTAGEVQAARAAWWRTFGALTDRLPAYAHDRTPDRPLKVGYVSADFCHHSARQTFGPVVLHHSAAIVPFCYSSTVKADAVTGAYATRPGWRELTGYADPVLIEQIRADAIDILVDLSGYTPGNRLGVFAAKPAPITITAWGYATGLGWPAPWNPVLFGDAVAVPPARRALDRVVDLPCLVTYEGPDVPPAAARPVAGPPVFGVFQRQMKFNDACVGLWRQILQRLPDARLIAKGDYSEAFARGLLDAFGAERDRVTIRGATAQRDHLRAYDDIDLCLDPFPQTGGVTTCEALTLGVPCVTLLGDRVIQRTSASILTAVGLEGFITTTPAAYVDRAVAWVTTRRDELAALRRTLPLQFSDSPVVEGYVAAVEQAYRALWHEWIAA